MGLGTSPAKMMRSRSRSTTGSGTGMADSRARVYGCRGEVKSSSVLRTSTSRPRYITAIRSETCLTTPRSCEMNRTVTPRSAWRSRSRLTICPLTETSRLETASSATSTWGDTARARAMAMR